MSETVPMRAIARLHSDFTQEFGIPRQSGLVDELEAAGAIICALAFFSGVNLFGTGLVGQYVGKTYMESKHRPRYFIEEIVE